ncbi:hypothetical protein GmHk_10G029502 [Glycine max]|uniref:RIN4 pathogenic type III effector avirulence factor Avr cleavage site domain-containing protein n=1 Tax=Glycine soja TaxID=3848 RepID=A0A445INK7_GLYSO|nr:uncharacterized protein LOC114369549 isoform X1 [Glycine soja]KAH1138681.1 hypothetical protein GYH30_028250 [Glycine max]KAG4983573.1 hypothetical protein JHK87_028322 [Glycine soja]KAH1229880.1 hypothetical protein GmHk_10G029502 [Glycine max]KHN14789.1 hypothetical protein glysoja_020962 [Glycine soja]RZB87650.1 hypothetical protein D0Y65_027304 [Glycine soja]
MEGPYPIPVLCCSLIQLAASFNINHRTTLRKRKSNQEWKGDEHIPAFGNWDFTNEFPITRYFECATQARLHNKPRHLRNHIKQETRNKERRCRHVNGNANKGKVYDVREQQRKPNRISKHVQVQVQQHDTVPRTPKPVDEDLYKIPPELLHTTNKRKKLLGFISKCLVLLVCHEHSKLKQ